MPRQFVDLSIFLENDVLSDPPAFAPKIEYLTHENTYSQIEPFFPGLQKGDLPDGEGWGSEHLNDFSSHCGTHVDAPLHSGSLCEGKPARTIDQIDLGELYRPGMVLDLRPWAKGFVPPA